jgi:hypothetical protein
LSNPFSNLPLKRKRKKKESDLEIRKREREIEKQDPPKRRAMVWVRCWHMTLLSVDQSESMDRASFAGMPR